MHRYGFKQQVVVGGVLRSVILWKLNGLIVLLCRSSYEI